MSAQRNREPLPTGFLAYGTVMLEREYVCRKEGCGQVFKSIAGGCKWCPDCRPEVKKRQRAASSRRHYRRNKPEILEKNKEIKRRLYRKNPAKFIARYKAYAAANPDKIRETRRRYRENKRRRDA